MAARSLYLALFLGLAVGYYYFLGPGPSPSERAMDLPFWRPIGWAHELDCRPLETLREFSAAYDVARHQGRVEPRGLIPFGLFALPALLLAALGFVLFRSIIVRVFLCALALTMGAFSYYGWLDPETWHDYSWRWPIALFVTALYLSVFALAPLLVRAAGSRSRLVQALGVLVFAVPIYFLSTEITGTNPNLEWNLSPWPVITLYGFLLFGLVLGVVHLATGLGLAALGRLQGNAGLVVGIATAALVAGLLRSVPFEQATLARTALLAATAAGLVAWVALRGEKHAAVVPFLVAAVLILLSVKLGQWQAEYFQAKVRDELSPRIIAALERYREEQHSYPLELSELAPRYLPALPSPRIGWLGGAGEAYTYTNLGDSFLLEFASVLWVQCAYSPAYEEERVAGEGRAGSAAPADVAAGPAAVEKLEASWSCERKPPRLW